jgi:SAM-dependent methyltransferase
MLKRFRGMVFSTTPECDQSVEVFRNIDEFQTWQERNPWNTDQKYVDDIVNYALKNGIKSRFLGSIPASEVVCSSKNYRESLSARNLNARQRAVLDMIADTHGANDVYNLRIYASEAMTAFARALSGRYSKFIGSEFAPTPEDQSRLFPIQHQDLAHLTFPSDVFDLVVTNDVLEHVPKLEASLAEMARVLKPGGVSISTFPFNANAEKTLVKAKLVGGELIYLGEPEYHGNPVDPDKGSLVFQIPGWDIIDMAKSAGFSRAEFVHYSSKAGGITAANSTGILIFRGYK